MNSTEFDPPDFCIQAADLPRAIRWESWAAGRFYEATVQLNLFGEWEVVSVWGGIASPRGGHHCRPVADRAEGMALVATVAHRREKRGYALTSGCRSDDRATLQNE